MCSRSVSLTLSSSDETANLARHIAPRLTAGDVLLLDGPIGAGKSFFARTLILDLLPVPEDIPSPTFTLVQTYDTPDFEIWHCDLYRLSTPYEVQELGIEDAFQDAVCLIEWPDRLGDLTPPDALTLTLSLTDTPDERHAVLTATDPKWLPLLESLDA
ncbi:tRNA (adenosine(37)-N6)-threonylcarbamoyltransferase complex ATPase subunit type 1 TsaE [Profundibacter sp.]|uniref:tRNA (adenosine(37)-N6)-threonylcarbamoyltransferase complex ATPase subunit type 1 TsaE n=1 Tax=Profundibacter sp. TaxID=3101071 RepID=UPI003D0CCB6B